MFGHPVGDMLMRAAADRLAAEADGAFVARIGGDEFMILMPDDVRRDDVLALAERLVETIGKELEVDDYLPHVGLSVGIAFYPDDGVNAVTLLANADSALYRAKREGRGRVRVFESEMDQELRDRRLLQHDLRQALEQNQFLVYFQPQARVDGEVIGFEALLRWNHPTRGFVPPDQFIPLAEENGLIVEIGEWVLREACREAASWPRPLQVAVNLSPVQFQAGDLERSIHQILLETGLTPTRLEVEITEGVLIGDFTRALNLLRRLKALGVRIAMDDFGTGYSSLSYLQSFPFDKIKIDRGFISNLGGDAAIGRDCPRGPEPRARPEHPGHCRRGGDGSAACLPGARGLRGDPGLSDRPARPDRALSRPGRRDRGAPALRLGLDAQALGPEFLADVWN
ncbi:putative bifunctional diguanylate cyclase/phosphodiesterase [Bradyrhizobium betae]